MANRQHTVKQGECLASIASQYGFASWRSIYEDPANEELREKRPDPHILFPGDLVTIPSLPEAKVELSTDQDNTVEVALDRTVLRLKVLDTPEGEPIAARYLLQVDGVGAPIEGKVSAEGIIEAEIPPRARSAKLQLRSETDDELMQEMELEIGELDPVTEPSGIRQRLTALGFDPGPEGGDPEAADAALEATLRLFQRRFSLEQTGNATQETQDKLVELAGG